MELTKDECKRILRRIELEAYSALVTALRAQGELDRCKKRLLKELGEQLSISTERHRAEIRRAINDDRLSMIAECVCGSHSSIEWESEGRRVVPLMPRLVPQTVFTGTATAAANQAAKLNAASSTAKAVNNDEDSKSRKCLGTATSVQNTIGVTSTSVCQTSTTISTKPTMSIKQEQKHNGLSKITGPNKSSVSVATNKYVAPLPASCLQAHASVVSGNSNRMNLNLNKTKGTKIQTAVSTSMKVKSVTSFAQNVTQPLLSISKKCNETANSLSKANVITRHNATSITVAPRTSLATLKTTIQSKQLSQTNSSKNVGSTTMQFGKTVSVSRRTLPTILPKTVSSLQKSPVRKLPSILPAPVKCTVSTITRPVVSGLVTSSQVAIPTSLHPPQSLKSGLSGTVTKSSSTISVATKRNTETKRDAAISPVHFSKSPVSSQDSSPISSKSLDNIHQRESLSPVNDILTLVTSPSSLPFIPSSPVKSLSKATDSCPISLECDENISEEFQEKLFKTNSMSSSSSKNILVSSNVVLMEQNLQDLATEPSLKEHDSVCSSNERSDTVSKTIDLSPLVNELLSNTQFDFNKKETDKENCDLLKENSENIGISRASLSFGSPINVYPKNESYFPINERENDSTHDEMHVQKAGFSNQYKEKNTEFSNVLKNLNETCEMADQSTMTQKRQNRNKLSGAVQIILYHRK
ncbi:BRCA2-interacting transcriptional repressor EMSY-like [Xenia sp. Carnegie-2017]|uniref:BRCA2-interacting transcriptional repressor EMSY-like n=1 Tax=Xenia sp. Carnegie-2017 TaxID=2897299 RepID=UPI001F03CC01|nr:BRCA2-interacting transcriptional repressor EMSY-like [Xenia sp. Carnegie-2017]XP_046854115.1 BRCA2-interacting transcriptional repressor EMSY-like [Xenia sp. Carnegie-2017]